MLLASQPEPVLSTRLFGWEALLSHQEGAPPPPLQPWLCSLAPLLHLCAHAPLHTYLMTLSAWKRTVGGMVRPSAWAVLRLMTNSKRRGCSTGRSAGLAPCRMRST